MLQTIIYSNVINKKVSLNLVIFRFIDIFVSKMIPKYIFLYEKVI